MKADILTPEEAQVTTEILSQVSVKPGQSKTLQVIESTLAKIKPTADKYQPPQAK